MEMSALKYGQKIQGPSGTVYMVVKVVDAYASLVSPYTQQSGTVPQVLNVDAKALERFKVFVGDL
jgi:hypothetical protein